MFLQATGAPAYDQSVFAARREALMKKIEGSLAVLQGAPDTRAYTAFRQDNNFYYLTGVEIPNALLLIDGTRRRTVLFLPPRDEKAERWEGTVLLPGPGARRETGIDDVLELSMFEEELAGRRDSIGVLYTPLSPAEIASTSRDRALEHDSARQRDLWDGRISRQAAFKQRLQSRLGDVSIKDLSPILDGMRRVKDAQEIERLRVAGHIGALGLREAMRCARAGMYEYQVAAIAGFIYSIRGAQGPAFFPIVGSGPNSCLPHYSANKRRMQNGDIVVMDFGADYRYYQSDITRTFPASGKFSKEQARVYQIVLDAQKAALSEVRPGARFGSIADAAKKVLRRSGYEGYLTHGVSHYIGMSVHDVGDPEPFEPGVVITVEPGVYMPEKALGIRIEDTVLVTQDGCEVLTGAAPKEMLEIERLMSETGFAEAMTD
jgi:Xaa-Pro aminopeptidase